MTPPEGDSADRRSKVDRVPFVQRCVVDFDDRTSVTAFLVNISVLGAYVSSDSMPRVGQRLSCRFRTPGNEREMILQGLVVWVNPHQPHPVHSRPPGFGVRFLTMTGADRRRIEEVVRDYIVSHPPVR